MEKYWKLVMLKRILWTKTKGGLQLYKNMRSNPCAASQSCLKSITCFTKLAKGKNLSFIK
jgi:hypothetical protein